jgi:hypothetical protein
MNPAHDNAPGSAIAVTLGYLSEHDENARDLRAYASTLG